MDTGRISDGAGGSPGLVSSGSDKGKIRSILVENHIAHHGLQNHPKATPVNGIFLRFSSNLGGNFGPFS
jgi:hypothetical protein